ncbi:MAG TPA: hypothetical protein DEH25_00910 [Chloroflexi bacterium]|nr:hypothetical protein [Chloroflexota bacterium]
MTTYEEIFAPLSGGRVLDVATGSGNFIHALDAALKEYHEIIGVDTNERFAAMFEQAFAGKPVNYRQMDAAHLNFPTASFDTVCLANSLHHLDDIPSVMAEIQRVLKPGAKLIISEMYRDGQSETQLTHVYLHHWWAEIDSAQGITHNETYTRQQLVDFACELPLADWQFHDVTYLDSDPQSPELIQQLNSAIDQYRQKAEGLPNQADLQARGEALRQRVQEIGFHGATTLVAIGSHKA